MKKNLVWITGARSGIGKELLKKFSSKNNFVLGTSRNINVNDKEFASLENIILEKNDISQNKDVEALVKKINNNFHIDCLINNAGVTSFKPFVENSMNDIETIIDTNLKGAIYATNAVLPKMIENKSGVIINILSVAAKKIFENSSVYAASKAGLTAFSNVLREEVRKHNIKVINIFPGATSTEIWPEGALSKYSSRMMSPENLANLIYDIYNNSNQLSPEEIVVRPISGDL